MDVQLVRLVVSLYHTFGLLKMAAGDPFSQGTVV